MPSALCRVVPNAKPRVNSAPLEISKPSRQYDIAVESVVVLPIEAVVVRQVRPAIVTPLTSPRRFEPRSHQKAVLMGIAQDRTVDHGFAASRWWGNTLRSHSRNRACTKRRSKWNMQFRRLLSFLASNAAQCLGCLKRCAEHLGLATLGSFPAHIVKTTRNSAFPLNMRA